MNEMTEKERAAMSQAAGYFLDLFKGAVAEMVHQFEDGKRSSDFDLYDLEYLVKLIEKRM